MLTDRETWWLMQAGVPPSEMDAGARQRPGTAHDAVVHGIWPRLGPDGPVFDGAGRAVMPEGLEGEAVR